MLWWKDEDISLLETSDSFDSFFEEPFSWRDKESVVYVVLADFGTLREVVPQAVVLWFSPRGSFSVSVFLSAIFEQKHWD